MQGVLKTFYRPCYQSMELSLLYILGRLKRMCMVKVYDWSTEAGMLPIIEKYSIEYLIRKVNILMGICIALLRVCDC